MEEQIEQYRQWLKDEYDNAKLSGSASITGIILAASKFQQLFPEDVALTKSTH